MSAAEVELVARVIGAVGHALGGSLQTVTNSLFVLRRRGDDWVQALDASVEPSLHRLRYELERLMALPTACRAPARARVAVAAIAESALAPFRARTRLVLEMGAGEALVDAVQATLALRELITNALEFSHEIFPVTVQVVAERGGLRARVIDEGTRAWPERVELALDPMFTTKPQSLGLGLAIAHAVARGHHGHLSIAPRPGGTVVELVLPLGLKR